MFPIFEHKSELTDWMKSKIEMHGINFPYQKFISYLLTQNQYEHTIIHTVSNR